MRVSIVGTNLPGRTLADLGGGAPCYDDVHVGVQRRSDGEQFQPGDAAEVRFEIDLTPSGDRDATGPYAHGRRGERFVYLAWVAGPEQVMFRRAKLWLRDIPSEVWTAGVAGDGITARLPLTDDRGGPVCATVKPPAITWTTGTDAPC